MTTRKQHIAEMRYALANNCTLFQARRRLARQRQIEADEFIERLERCGTVSPPPTQQRQYHRPDAAPDTDAPWMMRD